MKKLKYIIVFVMFFMIALIDVNASSFDASVIPEDVSAKAGGIVEIELSLKDIDMQEKGINAVEGYISYDSDVVESIDLINENEWKLTYNNDTTSDLYGKFISTKDIVGVTEEEKIVTIRLKIKEKINKQNSKIEIKEIVSNDGENLINIGNKVVNIEFQDIKAVNTGDNILIFVLALISSVLVLMIIMKNKKIKE